MKDCFVFWISVLIVSFAGFLSGYDTGVISGALLYIKQTFLPSSACIGFLVASVSLGAIFGALINGFLVDKYGRKKILISTGFIFAIGSIFCFYSQNIFQLICSRFIIGIAVGVVSFVAPLYLSEISIKEKRGHVVSFYQLALTFGILFSYLVNYFCANLESNWRIMLAIGVIPSVILFVGMFFQFETPRWLVLNKQSNKAKNILLKLNYPNPDSEIVAIEQTVENDSKLNKKLIKPMLIGVGIMFCQIATGINAIIYYAPTIFVQLGFNSNKDVLFVTIFIGLINFLMTFVAIAYVDKFGRKPLLYFGLSGILISLLVLSSIFAFDFEYGKYLAIIFSCIYIVCFSMSLGPIALLLISEIFPLQFRARAMSVAIISNFVFNFIVSGLFPVLLNKIGGTFVFLIFALIAIFAILFVYFIVPETKGKSLEQIEMEIKNYSLIDAPP